MDSSWAPPTIHAHASAKAFPLATYVPFVVGEVRDPSIFCIGNECAVCFLAPKLLP